MKIKTITCHDVYNVGASLQAYALVTYLQYLGHDAEIIDYKPEYLSTHYKLTGVSNPVYDKPLLREIYQLLKLPGRLKAKYSKRKKEYDHFTSTYLSRTKLRYHSNAELKENVPNADVYFAGSDQIWNTLFNNGKDPAFYLDFVPKGCIRASYAASFATNHILEEWKTQITDWISKLDYISVREKSGIDIINNLGISGQVQVLDPVFLLDANKWAIIEKQVVKNERYILVYDFDKNISLKSFATKMANEKRCKIYSVLSCDYADKCFDQEGPQAFVNLVHQAELVISNSFHATAFSLIFQKQFVVFNRKENINARMQDLLEIVGLENCLFSNQNTENVLSEIDYDVVIERLENYIEASKKYIDNVLEGVKDKVDEKEGFICN